MHTWTTWAAVCSPCDRSCAQHMPAQPRQSPQMTVLYWWPRLWRAASDDHNAMVVHAFPLTSSYLVNKVTGSVLFDTRQATAQHTTVATMRVFTLQRGEMCFTLRHRWSRCIFMNLCIPCSARVLASCAVCTWQAATQPICLRQVPSQPHHGLPDTAQCGGSP